MSTKKLTMLEVVISIFSGTLLHFVYRWSNNNNLVAIFGAINESVWEHCKLLLWPCIALLMPAYILYGRKCRRFFTAQAVAIIIGIYMIISLFYTYIGVLGKEYLVIDISIFVISVILSKIIGYQILKQVKTPKNLEVVLSMITIALLIGLFVLFTFNPPQIPLFKDPRTGSYGLFHI